MGSETITCSFGVGLEPVSLGPFLEAKCQAHLNKKRSFLAFFQEISGAAFRLSGRNCPAWPHA